MKPKQFALILLTVLIAGCVPTTAELTAVPTALLSTASATAVVVPDIPTPTPRLDTPVSVCTPPSCAADESTFCNGDCPGGCGTICVTRTPPPDADLPLAPAAWEPLAEWLRDAWAAGFNPGAVRSALQAAGWQSGDAEWYAADLTGDGLDEWILLLYAPEFAEKISPANLWVINENGRLYQLYDEPNMVNSFSLTPRVTGTADLTGDSVPELVVNEESCGAHTCFGNYQILTATNDGLTNVVQLPPERQTDDPPVISISYADTYFVDQTEDGVTDFLVHGGSIGSVGAGIVRTYTEVWAWDGTAVGLADILLDPTDYRHHILYEANMEMAAGNLDAARTLYQRAINDDTLITPEFLATPQETYADIVQFATFRLILLDLLQGDGDGANGRFTTMQQTYPNAPLTTAAATLLNQWSGADNLPALCASIAASLQTMENPTGALTDLGYGNPSLTAADVCPAE